MWAIYKSMLRLFQISQNAFVLWKQKNWERSRGKSNRVQTPDHGHFHSFEWRQNYKLGEMSQQFSPKVFWVISATVPCPYPYIHPFAQIRRPSPSCRSGCWLFHFDISSPEYVSSRLLFFHSVSFGRHWSRLRVSLKADKLHTNCIRLPTCWKGKLLANLLRVLTSHPVRWKFSERSNCPPALRCVLVMRAREHLLDLWFFCALRLVYSYLDGISVLLGYVSNVIFNVVQLFM